MTRSLESLGITRASYDSSLYLIDEISDMFNVPNASIVRVKRGSSEYFVFETVESNEWYGMAAAGKSCYAVCFANGYFHSFAFSDLLQDAEMLKQFWSVLDSFFPLAAK